MLSKKLTLSLASLLVLIAFGIAFCVPSAIAHDRTAATDSTNTFTVTLSVDESVQDVSSDEGVQIPSGRTREIRAIPEITDLEVAAGAGRIIVLATFEKEVHLQILNPADIAAAASTAGTELLLADGTLSEAAIDLISSDGAFGADDVRVDAFDNEGRNLGTRSLAEVLIRRVVGDFEAAVIIKHKNPAGRVAGELPSREFLIQIDQSELENVYAPQGRGGGVDPEVGLEIHTLLFSIAAGAVTESGRAEIAAFLADTDDFAHLHTSNRSNILQVDMVDDDEGNPNYAQIRGTTVVAITDDPLASDDGVPGVVYITAPNVVVRGEYYAHILLTEQPHAKYLLCNRRWRSGYSWRPRMVEDCST